MLLQGIRNDISLYRNAYFLAFSATMSLLLTGWDVQYHSGIVGGVTSLKSFQRYFELNTKSAAERAAFTGNFSSILSAGSFFGSLLVSYFFGRFGRKPCLIASAVIHVIGSLLQSIAGIGTSIEVGLWFLYVGRFLCGFVEGIGNSVAPGYLSESVPAAVRGRCSGAIQLATDFGVMLSFWINYGISQHNLPGEMQWRIPFIVQIIPGIIFAITMLFQHESPRWLVENARYDEAAKSLAFSYRASEENEHISNIIENIRVDIAERRKLSLWTQMKGIIESRPVIIRCYIACLVLSFNALSGSNAVNIFSPQIFGGLGISDVSSELFATGFYGIVKVLSAYVSLAFVVERIGRKNSLLVGSSGQALTMLWIGGYSALHPSEKIVPAGYVSIVALYLFAVSFCIGWGSVSWTISSEVAPFHLRPLVLSIAASLFSLTTFILSRVTPIMLEKITYGTYVFFGIGCIIMGLWAYVFLPDTTGYALEDIKYLFEKDVILRSLQDAPGGRIFIGKRRAESVEELRVRREPDVKAENRY